MDTWMEGFNAAHEQMGTCDSYLEDCSKPYEWQTEADEQNALIGSIVWLVFDWVFAIVPVAVYYGAFNVLAVAGAIVGTLSGTSAGWGYWVLLITGYFHWITSMIMFLPAAIIGIFSYFPETFGNELVDFYMTWNHNAVFLGGAITQGLAALLYIIAAIGTVSTSVWAWAGSWTALTIGMYIGYAILYDPMIVYYATLVGQANNSSAIEDAANDVADAIDEATE